MEPLVKTHGNNGGQLQEWLSLMDTGLLTFPRADFVERASASKGETASENQNFELIVCKLSF